MNEHKYGSNGDVTMNVDDVIQANQASRFKHFIVIWENILQFIAGLAARAGEVETGGELYGLLSHAGRPVIMLATPPGPGAIREKARFCQDIEFMKEINAYLSKKYGMQYHGNHHHHHNMFGGPSGGDIRSTHSIAKKNQYKSMVQIVLTFEDEPLGNYQSDPPNNGSKRREDVSRIEGIHSENTDLLPRGIVSPNIKPAYIRVNAFLYSDAMHGQPTRCRLKVLPGSSLFTDALNRKPGVSELMACPPHPLSRIIYDSIESPPEPTAQSPELPRVIKDQCVLLPENVQETIEIVFKEDLVLLSLALPEKNGEVIVAYQEKYPCKAAAVYLIIKKPVEREPKDITSESLRFGRYTRLSTIYNRAVRLHETIVEKVENPAIRPHSSHPQVHKKAQKRTPLASKSCQIKKSKFSLRRSNHVLLNQATHPGRKGAA